jgi:hypothetical protein
VIDIIYVRVFPCSVTFGADSIDIRTSSIGDTHINYCHALSLRFSDDELCSTLFLTFSNRFSNSLHCFQRATKAPG